MYIVRDLRLLLNGIRSFCDCLHSINIIIVISLIQITMHKSIIKSILLLNVMWILNLVNIYYNNTRVDKFSSCKLSKKTYIASVIINLIISRSYNWLVWTNIVWDSNKRWIQSLQSKIFRTIVLSPFFGGFLLRRTIIKALL